MKKVASLFLFGLTMMFLAGESFATEASTSSSDTGLIAIAASMVIGIAALGGTLGQGRAAASALDGIARNPGASGKIFVPMILGMALIESLVLFALLVAFMLMGKM